MPARSLQTVWATSGGLCGKYLASSMSNWLERMEAEGSLAQGRDKYSTEVRAELESMSAATIESLMLLLLSSGGSEGLLRGEPVAVFMEESGVTDVAAFDA